MLEEKKLLRPEEVAEQLQVSERTIRRWLRAGELRGIRVGRLWRIRRKDLAAFLDKGDTDRTVK